MPLTSELHNIIMYTTVAATVHSDTRFNNLLLACFNIRQNGLKANRPYQEQYRNRTMLPNTMCRIVFKNLILFFLLCKNSHDTQEQRGNHLQQFLRFSYTVSVLTFVDQGQTDKKEEKMKTPNNILSYIINAFFALMVRLKPQFWRSESY